MSKKIKNNLRNPQAENDPKFKKRAGWPKNLVSYKKENVYQKKNKSQTTVILAEKMRRKPNHETTYCKTKNPFRDQTNQMKR